jgi:hypothetical protein
MQTSTLAPSGASITDQYLLPGVNGNIGAWINAAPAAESGNNPSAQSPTSSAQGLFQFTQPTWDGLVTKYGKQYGLTADGRTDPKQSTIGAQLIAQDEYAPALQSVGVSNPSPDDYQQVHFWGTPNFKKLAAAHPDTKLSDALGDQFGGVYAANKGLFGDNPNITVSQAGAAVDSRLPGGSVSALPQFLGGSNNGAPLQQPQQSQGPMQNYTATGQAQPLPDPSNQTSQGGTPQYSAPVMPQGAQAGGATGTPVPTDGWLQGPSLIQSIFNHGKADPNSMFSRVNLLRMAAGLGAGNPNAPFAGMAASLLNGAQQDTQNAQQQMQIGQGQQQLQQTGAYQQGQLGIDQQRARNDQVNSAITLMQMGYHPDLAFSLASGKMSQQQAAQALANVPPMIGKVAAGDVWETPNGGRYQQENRPFGLPVYVDMTSGQTMPQLPPGAYRAQDPAAKISQTDDATAENGLFNQAQSANQTLSTISQIDGMVGQVNTGNSLASVLSRNASQLLGRPVDGNDPAVQQFVAQQLQTLAGNRLQALRGLGRLDLPEVNNALKSGGNLENNPTALKAILAWQGANASYTQDQYSAWMNASDAERAKGFRNWSYNYQKQNPMSDYVKSYIQNNAPDLLSGGQSSGGGSSVGSNTLARPVTQQDFAALPSGALYVNPADGQTYRKK